MRTESQANEFQRRRGFHEFAQKQVFEGKTRHSLLSEEAGTAAAAAAAPPLLADPPTAVPEVPRVPDGCVPGIRTGGGSGETEGDKQIECFEEKVVCERESV